jgi:hypothetical protein
MGKLPSLGIKVDPEIKDALQRAAAQESRSVSNMINKILVDWLRANGYLK